MCDLKNDLLSETNMLLVRKQTRNKKATHFLVVELIN